MKRMVSLSAGLLALVACQPDKVNEPTSEAAPVEARVTEAAVTNAHLSALSATLDDAVVRLVPALDDVAAAVLVGPQLEQMLRAIATGNRNQALQALADARAALGRAGGTPNGAAIGLALDRAEALLSASEANQRSETGRDEQF